MTTETKTAPAETLHDACVLAETTCGQMSEVHEITEEAYWEALEVLPPIYNNKKRGGFWVSEPYCHDTNGRPICLECWQDQDSKYYCRYSAVPAGTRL